MKVNFINLDINNQQIPMPNNNYFKQQLSFEDLSLSGNNMNINMINNINFNMIGNNNFHQKPNFRSQSLSVQHLLDLNQSKINTLIYFFKLKDMGNLPIINALSINGNVQNNEKNSNYDEYDISSPNQRAKKTLSHQFNKTKAKSVEKTKSTGAIPLKSLLKSIGAAISQNKGNQNISSLISKIPNNQNKNSTLRMNKKN